MLVAIAGVQALWPAEPPPPTPGVRLKDLIMLEGVRDNQLIGYELVVGLAGTGDRRWRS